MAGCRAAGEKGDAMSRAGTRLFHLARLLLGGTFLYAGWIKAADPVGFARQVANYQLLPYAANYLVAAALPYVELLAGLLLVANRKVRPAALVLGGLNGVFMLALATVVARGLDIDCGCFDPSGATHTGPWEAILRDSFLMVLAVVVWILRGRQMSASSKPAGE